MTTYNTKPGTYYRCIFVKETHWQGTEVLFTWINDGETLGV